MKVGEYHVSASYRASVRELKSARDFGIEFIRNYDLAMKFRRDIVQGDGCASNMVA